VIGSADFFWSQRAVAGLIHLDIEINLANEPA
jgi:hypothetical protein